MLLRVGRKVACEDALGKSGWIVIGFFELALALERELLSLYLRLLHGL